MITSIVVPLAAVALTLTGGWFVTTRVSYHWDQIKRRREMDLASAEEFQRLYGEFFAVWKTWNAVALHQIKVDDSSVVAWDCLKRTADIGGRVESLLAKISAERKLSQDDIDVLGAVRQGFKSIRSVIKKGEPLPWWGSEVESYLAFKSLAVYTSGLLGTSSTSKHSPSSDVAVENFRQITSNKHEKSWQQTGQKIRSIGTSPTSSSHNLAIKD
jgi:hypothetical protein